MKAIILAAGQGTRLRPHTNHKPKCMVELAGKPLLHYQLEVLKKVGVSKILVIGGYCADQLIADGIEKIINYNYENTNMVSTLFCANNWMAPDEDLLVAYGDIVYEEKVLTSLLQVDAPLVISVDLGWQNLWEARMEDPLSDAETLKLNKFNQVIELGKKPKTIDEIQGQYMGLIKIRKDFISTFINFWNNLDRTGAYDGKDFDNMYMTSYLQNLINAGLELRAAFTYNGWIEIDTSDDLMFYENLYEKGELDKFVKLEL